MEQQMSRLTVFTGSSAGKSPAYLQAAQNFGRDVAASGFGIIFGGGHVGLMGAVADAALNAGGEVIGVMPQSIAVHEVPHQGLTRLDMVPDMHTRKARMAELGDAFVVLPGGAGTLEEFFEIWTWQQLGLHAKPVALYNVDGFWDPLINILDYMQEQGFIRQTFRDALIIAQDTQSLLAAIADWSPEASSKTSV